MAFETVIPQNLFLREQGLRYLYFPSGMPVEKASPETPITKQAIFVKKQTSSPSSGQTEKSVVKDRAYAAAQTPDTRAARPGSFKSIPFSEWPETWQKQFNKTVKGKLIWTYWQLGADLIGLKTDGEGDQKKRGDFLRKILKELAQPKGTHCLWPMALPDENGEYKANPQIFWSGVAEMQCRAVVILGSSAAIPLLPGKKLQPLDEFRHYGHMVWILRDIKPLLESASWYHMTLAFLKNAFQSHIRSW